jgi:hypothetical protein
MIKRLAYVYTSHAGVREHFELPADYDRFHEWVLKTGANSEDRSAFERHHAVVKWYLSNMSFANRQGMFQTIVWQDVPECAVTVEHHEVPTTAPIKITNWFH